LFGLVFLAARPPFKTMLLANLALSSNDTCPTNSTPVVCLGGAAPCPGHGEQPCSCPSNYACIDSASKKACTPSSYYCDCHIEQCANISQPCSTGDDCCTDDVPPGYSVYCGGQGPFKCSLKLDSCNGTKCGPGATSCCGPNCLTQAKCCSQATGAHGNYCCGATPYSGGTTTCCSGKIVPSRECCHGKPYNPDSGKQQCCATGPCTIPPGKSSCC
jgi:hypothetical protein